MKGRADPAAVARIVDGVSRYTGLDPALVKRMGGQVRYAHLPAGTSDTGKLFVVLL